MKPSEVDSGGELVGTSSVVSCYKSSVVSGDDRRFETAQPELDLLNEAARLITGDRNGDYGEAVLDYTGVAAFWTTYLGLRGLLKEGAYLDPKDCCQMLVLLKLRREITKPKRDNLSDQAGYTGLAYRCEVLKDPPD